VILWPNGATNVSVLTHVILCLLFYYRISFVYVCKLEIVGTEIAKQLQPDVPNSRET